MGPQSALIFITNLWIPLSEDDDCFTKATVHRGPMGIVGKLPGFAARASDQAGATSWPVRCGSMHTHRHLGIWDTAGAVALPSSFSAITPGTCRRLSVLLLLWVPFDQPPSITSRKLKSINYPHVTASPGMSSSQSDFMPWKSPAGKMCYLMKKAWVLTLQTESTLAGLFLPLFSPQDERRTIAFFISILLGELIFKIIFINA